VRVTIPMAALLALAACASAATEPDPAPSYTDVLTGIATERAALAERWRVAKLAKGTKGATQRAEILREAREAARRRIVGEVFPPWFGTRWDFNGVSQTPGEGTIACGYFVSTVLRDAGFKVERIRLAQQASENIVRTLSPPDAIRTFRNKSPDEVIEDLRKGEDGLFAVGFDYHVGFVVKEGETVTFCHSSWIKSGGVACEDPATTDAWYSTYYVVGRLFDDPMLIAWLEEAAIPTRRK